MIEWGKVLLLAVFFDILFGEPPAFLHPVVWMGKLINIFVGAAPRVHRKLYGLIMVFFCVGITVLTIKALEFFVTGIMVIVISAYFLKSSFSIRMLLFSAIGIQRDLGKGNIEKVRTDLKTFVGRDTSNLNAHQSASAVIESLAESFVDGILSPLFYFLLFGLPGALACRMINTLDSMVGYKKEPFVKLGYAAARIDDLVNFVPSRLSLIVIFVSSILFGKPLDAIKICKQDYNKTASPNSGWPMAAVSGALNVRLEKIGYHVIGNNYNDPGYFDIQKAINLVGFSSFLVICVIYWIGKIPLMG
ncbi:MAG: cobalamin biosynthesis protein [Candidatus Methanoperedens sp.]|nr:cobalamin biosynthesis protein [Candidatus Methanoperedens sp.]